MKLRIITLCLCALAFSLNAFSQTPAFPGAEGGGKYTTGGRGGKVYYVNTLVDNSSGDATTREGSLRWCLAQSGTKTILFKVSGVIELTKALEIKGNVTIAGQTAPGDGICLKDYPAVVKGSNVIIRFIRFRPGDAIVNGEHDGIWGREQSNIILDHCSMGWATDECSSFYSNKDFTMQWCILHEGLLNSQHSKGSHSYGGLWGGYNATFHHNLLIHNNSRNPRFNGYKRSGLKYGNPQPDEIMDFRNNVLYNWGDNSGYGGEAAGKYNVVNNYYRSGNGTASGCKTRIIQIDKDTTTIYKPVHGVFHVTGNVMHGNSSVTNNNANGIYNKSGASLSVCTTSTPYTTTAVPTHTAQQAYEKVLEYAGASLVRDTIERRLVREAKNGITVHTGTIGKRKGLIDKVSDAEGWAMLNYKSTTAPTDSNIDGIPDGWLEEHYPGKKATDKNDEGYTYLEVYLNSLVDHITSKQYEGVASPVEIDHIASDETNTRMFYNGNNQSIQVKSDKTIQRVQVYSGQGYLVADIQVGADQAEITNMNLAPGLHIVKAIFENGGTSSGKILVKN